MREGNVCERFCNRSWNSTTFWSK